MGPAAVGVIIGGGVSLGPQAANKVAVPTKNIPYLVIVENVWGMLEVGFQSGGRILPAWSSAQYPRRCLAPDLDCEVGPPIPRIDLTHARQPQARNGCLQIRN